MNPQEQNAHQQWWEAFVGGAYANSLGQQAAYAQQESQQRVSEVSEVRRCGVLMMEARDAGWTARVAQYETLGFCVQFRSPANKVVSGPLRLGQRAALVEAVNVLEKELNK